MSGHVRLLAAAFAGAAALLGGAAGASAMVAVPPSTVHWVATAADPAGAMKAIEEQRSKLAAEFEERLDHVGADGRLRVMVTTTSRDAAVRELVERSTAWAEWYPGIDAFYGGVSPDQLARLLRAPEVVFVDPDYPVRFSLWESVRDARARTSAGGSLLPDGSEEGTVSYAQPTLRWTGATTSGYTGRVANVLGSVAGVQPVCQAPTCHTFRLHVADGGDLTVNAVSPPAGGTRFIAMEIEKPDGTRLVTHGDSTRGTTMSLDGTPPGAYVVRTWVSTANSTAQYAATATLTAPGRAPSGIWTFDPEAGRLGGLLSADRHLDVAGATGRGVGVAIIDSGIDRTHPDFGGFDCEAAPYEPCQSRIKEAVSISHIVGGTAAQAAESLLPTTEVASGHGTHVAGIVAGNGYAARDGAGAEGHSAAALGDSGVPIGMAPEASLVSIKNGDGLSAGLSNFGLTWLAQNAGRLGVRVVNNSWGCARGCAYDPAAATSLATRALYRAGVLVVFAAGNDAGGADGVAYSGNAQSPYVLGVANYDAGTDAIASSSSRGAAKAASPDPAGWDPDVEADATKTPEGAYRRPDVAAPGTNIWAARALTGGAASTAPRVDTFEAGAGPAEGTGSYVQMTGTSMAAPHVAGAGALLFSACPQAKVLDVMRAVMASADATALQTTDGSRLAQPFETGYGALDVRAAVDWLRANVPACSVDKPPVAVIDAPESGLEGEALTFDGSRSSDADGPISAYRWSFGDGSTAEGAVVQHSYAEPGTYSVTLSVSDSRGATSSTTHSVVIAAQPDPDPATPTLTSGVPAADTSQSRDEWRFYKVKVRPDARGLDVALDGEDCEKRRCKPDLDLYLRAASRPAVDTYDCKSAAIGSDETCSVAAPAAGYWYVGVRTAAGKEGSPFTITATVSDALPDPDPNAPPTAAFTATCSGLTCAFGDGSSDTDGSVVEWAWEFGDGSVSTAASPQHAYPAAGVYEVRLTVTDDDGATASTTRTVTVGGDEDPDPDTPTLSNGAPASATSGPTDAWAYYKIRVPEGRQDLTVTLAGRQNCPALVLVCSPDLDLYVRPGQKPDVEDYECAPLEGDINESCVISAPAPGWWYVGVHTYDSGFLGVTPEERVNYTVTATHR